MGLFILLALFFFYLGYTYLKNLEIVRNNDQVYTLTAATCLQFFLSTSQPESLIYAKMKLLRFKRR